MKPQFQEALGYNDISILPNFSSIRSRRDVDTSTVISKHFRLKYPIILSPMDKVSTEDSCIALNKIGAAGILHRFMEIDKQVELSKEIRDNSGVCYSAVGLRDIKNRIEALYKAGVNVFVLDSANGLNRAVYDFTKWFFTESPYHKHCDLIVGNTLTKESVSRLINVGASGVRHLIGPGSACSTPVMTGIYCPSITGIYYAHKAVRNWELYSRDWDLDKELERPSILVDGGIRYPSDLVKAILAGADAVICGRIFAGCCENTDINDIVEILGSKKVRYRGMASLEVVQEYELSDGTEENLFVEGASFDVPIQERSVTSVVYEFINGLRSAMSYLGFNTLDEMRGALWNGKVIAVKVTQNSNYEVFPHGK